MKPRRSFCRVLMSGNWPLKKKPDTSLVNHINRLRPVCRVCQVFTTVESSGEFRQVYFAKRRAGIPSVSSPRGLE